MVMIKDKDGIERFSISTDLHNFIERAKEKIHKDDDMVIGVLWGKVGCGKSLRAMHMAYAMDPTLDETAISRVCFDKEEFINAVLDNRKKVIIADEGISLFFSRAAMTKESRLMQEMMAQIRQKNLIVLICVPELLSLDWLIIKSANFICGIWESRKNINGRMVTIKGNMEVYPEIPGNDYKTRIFQYLRTKRSNSFSKKLRRPRPPLMEPGNPVGDGFKKAWYPVGEEEYRKKKEAILDKYRGKKEVLGVSKNKPMKTIKKEIIKDIIINAKKNNPEFTDRNIAKVLGYSRRRVHTLRNEGMKGKIETDN